MCNSIAYFARSDKVAFEIHADSNPYRANVSQAPAKRRRYLDDVLFMEDLSKLTMRVLQ